MSEQVEHIPQVDIQPAYLLAEVLRRSWLEYEDEAAVPVWLVEDVARDLKPAVDFVTYRTDEFEKLKSLRADLKNLEETATGTTELMETAQDFTTAVMDSEISHPDVYKETIEGLDAILPFHIEASQLCSEDTPLSVDREGHAYTGSYTETAMDLFDGRLGVLLDTKYDQEVMVLEEVIAELKRNPLADTINLPHDIVKRVIEPLTELNAEVALVEEAMGELEDSIESSEHETGIYVDLLARIKHGLSALGKMEVAASFGIDHADFQEWVEKVEALEQKAGNLGIV